MQDRLADALIAIEKRIPAPVVALIAIAFYPVFGLLVPVWLGWSLTALVVANLVGVYMAAIVTMGWLAGRLQAIKRLHLLDWTTDLRHLNAEEFEWVVGETFRREGWHVTESGSQDQGDGNIDIKLSRNGERMIVQCKRWTSRDIGVDKIREFLGTLSVEGLQPKNGAFVTFSDLTPAAEELARKAGLPVLDADRLFKKMQEVRRSEICEKCHKKMRLDHSAYGWWFRCVTAGCDGKRNLGDAGRAILFLTEAN